MILKKIAIVCLTIVGIMGSGYFIAGCNPDRQQMRQMIQSIVTGLKGKNDDSVYISHLSMFDRTRDSAKHTSEEVELLNNAILSGIKQVTIADVHYKYDVSGRTFPTKKINQLSRKVNNMYWDDQYSPTDLQKLIQTLSKKYRITTIVTGSFWQGDNIVMIVPMIYHNGDMTSKEIKSPERKVFCTDSLTNNKTLCSDMDNKISATVKELLQDLNR